MHLRFCQSESAFDYMMATRDHIDKHGKPVAFYSDKHSVFRVSQSETRRTGIDNANAWIETFISDFNRRFARPAKYPKNLHRTVSESSPELDDIFAWQALRTLSKSLTFQYDKILYLFEPIEENSRIAGEKILAFGYPDGTLAFRYGSRTREYQMFDRLECVSQGWF